MKHPTWEYHLEAATQLNTERLDDLGRQGWELVAVRETADQAIFKRIGPDYRERITIAQRKQFDASRNGAADEA